MFEKTGDLLVIVLIITCCLKKKLYINFFRSEKDRIFMIYMIQNSQIAGISEFSIEK